MLTKTMKIDDSIITIPGLGKYKGKMVEIIIKEKKKDRKKEKKLGKFFSLCGKVSIDAKEIEKLRESSYI